MHQRLSLRGFRRSSGGIPSRPVGEGMVMEHTEHCQVDAIEVSPGREGLRETRKVLLSVAGLGCSSCVNRVRNAILRVPGVVQVELALSDGVASVWYRGDSRSREDFVSAVARAGHGTHHSYLAVPLEPWLPDSPEEEGAGPS